MTGDREVDDREFELKELMEGERFTPLFKVCVHDFVCLCPQFGMYMCVFYVMSGPITLLPLPLPPPPPPPPILFSPTPAPLRAKRSFVGVPHPLPLPPARPLRVSFRYCPPSLPSLLPPPLPHATP